MTAILSAGEMRAAEQRLIDSGTPVETLMERAGAAVAEAVSRFAGPLRTLILCGPGNNGGDGYVVARLLRERGVDVTVAALGTPKGDAAVAACAAWQGRTVALAEAEPAPMLIDALFGTGLQRPLDGDVAGPLAELAQAAHVTVAVDLPSGAATDDGALLSPVPAFDLTVALGALKPAHLLQPAAAHMGRLVIADIGIEARSDLALIERPILGAPGPEDHKYSRGYVLEAAGAMPGAAALAASAAARGAGYVRLISRQPVGGVPRAVVQVDGDLAGALEDTRIGGVVIGPGLGRGKAARALLDQALASDHPLVLDGDALALLDVGKLALRHVPILTPHAGEFARLFVIETGSKLGQAREAARQSGAVVVYKGADTVVASPDGRSAIAAPAPGWLATAGTGDVLAGIIAAMRARGLDAFDAACAGVWLHARAAELAGPALIADDLLDRLAPALAECA